MLIIGTFEHSIELELALAELEHNNISRNNILVVLMSIDQNTTTLSNNTSKDFYSKGIEIGIACATFGSVIGASVGFALAWGPVICGLLAALIGFFIAFGIYLFAKKATNRHLPKKLPEVTVVIKCLKDQSNLSMQTMWKYGALTVGQVIDSF